jgi:hypothetical protein
MDNAWLLDMQGPLNVPVLMQCVQVRECLDLLQLTEGEDTVAWR